MEGKILKCLAAVALGALLAGCASVKAASEEGRTVIAGECSAWRFFFWIPLFGGDCEDPNDNFCVWFRNTATLENTAKLFDYACTRKGARGVKNVRIYVDDDYFFLFFRRTTMYSSAELVY